MKKDKCECVTCPESLVLKLLLDMVSHASQCVMRVDRLTSRSMILTLREVLTKRHCVLKARLEL